MPSKTTSVSFVFTLDNALDFINSSVSSTTTFELTSAMARHTHNSSACGNKGEMYTHAQELLSTAPGLTD